MKSLLCIILLTTLPILILAANASSTAPAPGNLSVSPTSISLRPSPTSLSQAVEHMRQVLAEDTPVERVTQRCEEAAQYIGRMNERMNAICTRITVVMDDLYNRQVHLNGTTPTFNYIGSESARLLRRGRHYAQWLKRISAILSLKSLVRHNRINSLRERLPRDITLIEAALLPNILEAAVQETLENMDAEVWLLVRGVAFLEMFDAPFAEEMKSRFDYINFEEDVSLVDVDLPPAIVRIHGAPRLQGERP